MSLRLAILLAALPGILAAQAAVETAIGTGRAATTAAPAKKVGDAIAGAFDRLNRTLQTAGNSTTASGSATTVSTTVSTAASATVSTNTQAAAETRAADSFEDPTGIRQGMDYATEVVSRFGPPALTLTTGPGEQTLCYARNRISVNVIVRAGKVAVVQKAGGPDRSTGLTIR